MQRYFGIFALGILAMNLFQFVFSRLFVQTLLKFIGVVLALVLVVILWLRFYTGHNDVVEVPNIRGMKIDEASVILSDMDLFYEVIDSVYNEGEQGTILEQIPEAGAKVKESRILFVTINSTVPPMKKVNVRIGESLRIASTKLSILGIGFDTEYRPDICNDCVLAMKYKGKEIKTGDAVRKGDRIKLILGQTGKGTALVPNLYGLSLDSAQRALSLASLTLGYPFFDADVLSREDSVKARVYTQTPKSLKTGVLIGSPVDVWLTLRPLPEQETDSTEMINVSP
jgi:beta-lactam-binding protein with PASTA domain